MRQTLHKLLLLCTAVALAGGCTEKYPNPDHYVGAIAGNFTRTSYSPEGIQLKGKWNAGDRIAVKSQSGGASVTLTAASSGIEVDFGAEGNATLPKPTCTAYYPPEAENGVPTLQHYSPAGPAEVPMSASSETRYLEFSPICALLEIKLVSQAGDIKVSGISIDDRYTLDCADGVAVGASPISFWFALPAGKLTGTQLNLTTTDGKTGCLTLSGANSIDLIKGEITTCNVILTSLTGEAVVPETAHLPNGLNFSRYIKCAARPEADWTQIIGATNDSLITSIKFLTESDITSAIRIDDGGDAPVYLSFDKATGAMTVSTPARKYLMHELGGYMFRDLFVLESIDFGNMVAPDLTSIAYMFQNCEKLRSLDLRFMNTSQTVRMEYTFSHCYELESLDVSSFKTTKVTTMTHMFDYCRNLKKLDISSFETPLVTSMTYLLAYCSSLEELDMRNLSLENVTGASFNYGLHALASLRKLWVGPKFLSKDGARPSSMFVNTTTVQADRPGSKGGLTIYTVQTVADWLAICNLRWVHSGHKGQSPIDVKFYDIETGNPISVTWGAN